MDEPDSVELMPERAALLPLRSRVKLLTVVNQPASNEYSEPYTALYTTAVSQWHLDSLPDCALIPC
jgi:hypothetical protein